MTTFTIEIDCAPGSARPDSYIDGVVKDLNLEVKDPVSKFFGNWTWVFQSDRYEEIKPIIKERITALYNSGCIRYGSW